MPLFFNVANVLKIYKNIINVCVFCELYFMPQIRIIKTERKRAQPQKKGRKKMKKIKVIYLDGTAEIREIIKNSIPETTLEAAKETGKQVINCSFIED